jgi:hypothetical protein
MQPDSLETMEAKLISEHNRKMRFKTIIPLIMVGMLCLTSLAGIGGAFYMYVTGQIITWFDVVILICFESISVIFWIMIARFIRRMFSVRRVLLFEDDGIGVVTWRNKLLTAKLPDNIKHMLIIGNDLTVTLQVENRYFVVSSEEFSNKDGINEFLRRILQRYQTQAE